MGGTIAALTSRNQPLLFLARGWLREAKLLWVKMAAGNDRDREEWKTSGLIKTPGIPAPSGDYKVGCLDLMDETGLLVRLFYPTSAAGGGAGGYQYAKAVADSKYTKATLQLNNIRMAWLLTSAVSKLAGEPAAANCV